MTNSILFSIKVGGSNVSVFNIKNVLSGIIDNVFYKNYEIHLSIENSIRSEVKNFFQTQNFTKNVSLINHNDQSWYEWLSYSFEQSKNFDYLITLHDDTYFMTKNFDKMFIDEVKNIDNLGAFTFIDDGYKRRFFNPQLRGAYHIDRIYENSRANGTEYEYHNQKPNWHKKMVKLKKGLNLLNLAKKKKECFKEPKLFEIISELFLNYKNLDFPQEKTKVHSVWTNIMGFKSKNISSFNITDLDIPHGVFADEDICLSTQINNLINVLIPRVHYYHDREIDISRSWKAIKKDYDKVSKLFYQKWKFYPIKLENVSLGERKNIINYLDKEYNGKLTWTKHFKSYEWIYI
jgi:hypothetical protein